MEKWKTAKRRRFPTFPQALAETTQPDRSFAKNTGHFNSLTTQINTNASHRASLGEKIQEVLRGGKESGVQTTNLQAISRRSLRTVTAGAMLMTPATLLSMADWANGHPAGHAQAH